MKAKTIDLPEDIKKQIAKDIATIKTLLKDDKAFADETIEKILTLNVAKVHSDFIRDHMGKRYLSIKDGMTEKDYDEFIDLESKVNDLVDLIRLDHELTEPVIDEKYLELNSDVIKDNPAYKFQFVLSSEDLKKLGKPNMFSILQEKVENFKKELCNEISDVINNSYKLPFEEIQITGNTEGTNE